MRRIARRFRFALLALLAVAVWSCEDHTGPGGITAHFALAPTFASSSAGIVDIDSVRVRLFRADETLALDTVVAVDADAESVALDLRVVISSDDEVFQMFLEYITPTGETAFTGGPIEVSPSSDDAEPVVIDVEVVYVGVGADAASVEITTTGASVLFGDTVQLTAVARNSAGEAIPGTPVAWLSLDTARAAVPDAAVGAVVGVAERGSARITATLLTGPTDSASVLVQPVPSLIVVTGGNDQRGPSSTELPVPVTVVVSAADQLPVQGVPVLFQTGDGGSFSVDSLDTDVNGEAQTLWTLGAGVGAQSATATVAEFPTVQASIGATAVSPNVLNWTNALGGNWSDPANWDANRVPVATDNVFIELDGTYTVTLDVAAAVDALTVGGASGMQTLALSSSTLTLSGTGATVGGTGALDMNGATLTGTGSLSSAGVVRVSGGVAVLDIALTNSGSLDVQSGGLEVKRGGTSTGTINTVTGTSTTVSAGTVDITGGSTTADGSLVVLAGATLRFSAGTHTFSASSSVSGAGDIDFAGGLVTLVGSYSVTGTSTEISGGTAFFQNTTTPATMTTLRMTSGILDGPGDVHVSSLLEWSGGMITGGGQLLIQSTAAATFAGGLKVFDSKELVNQGSVTWTAGDIDVQNGAPISNSSGASFDIQGDVVLDWTTGSEPSIANSGTVTRSVGAGSAAVNFMFINGGTLDVKSGTLGMNASFSHQSTATIQGAGTLNLSGGLVTAGTINMTGRLSLPGILSPPVTYSVGTTVFTGASQTIPSTLTYQDVEVTGLSVSFAAGATSILGSLVINGGMLNVDALDLVDVGVDVQISNNGELYIGTGGAFTVSGDFQTMTGGHFSMTTSTDVLTVKGNVDIQGGSTNTLLTDGTMYIGGSFSQGPAGDPASYAPSNLFLTVFNGTGMQTVSFANPGPGTTESHFQDLQLDDATDAVFNSDAQVNGSVTILNFPVRSTGGSTVTIAADLQDQCGECGGAWNVENTVFTGSPTGLPSFVQSNVTFTGDAMASFINIVGDLTVAGNGKLDLNSSWVSVTGDFRTQDNGTLAMFGTSDQLTVTGDIVFGGGNTDGLLFDGLIRASGDFTQLNTTDDESFHAGGFHTVDFVGSAAQTLTFASPGIGVGVMKSHFANVGFNNTASGVTLGSAVYAHSDLRSNAGASPAIIIGNGNTLAVGALDVNDLELRRVLLEWRGSPNPPYIGAFNAFNNVDFKSYNAADTQFMIFHPGALSTTYFFSGLTFDTPPTLDVGYYVKAEDSDGISPDVLMVDLGFFSPVGLPVPPNAIPVCAMTNEPGFNSANDASIFYSCS